MGSWHAIIPAGGAGTRLWPLSRQNHPKFLLDLLGNGKSLLQATVDRVSPFVDSVTVVTGRKHYAAVKEQLPALGSAELPGRIIAEPSPRDSMAAISVAAYLIGAEYGDQAVVSSFAADHCITNTSAFETVCRQSVQAAQQSTLTTIGISPTEPSTAFGYIAPSQTAVAQNAYLVEKFVEKPAPEVAQRFVDDGYLWNAGMFTAQVSNFAKWTKEFLPQMDLGLQQIAHEYQTSNAIDQTVWQGLQRIAIDYALAEPLSVRGEVSVVPASNLGWSDVGDFAVLQQFGSSQNVVQLRGQGNLALPSSSTKMVGFIGMEDCLVVDGDDAILVLPKNESQQVKAFVDLLRENGDTRFL